MASILRSNKFVRYFAGLARNIVFNTTREAEGNLVQQSQCLCNNLSQGFATAASKQDQTLDSSLKKLDQDVRRSGRISRRDIEEVLDEIRLQRSATSSQSLLVIRCCGNLVPEELPEVRTTLVQEIWKTLNNLKVPMDISHYNALLRVYLENEHPFSPTEFLTDLETKGIEPNRVTYQRLISRYCQQGDIDGATRILEYMREKQLPVNENVFNALIMGHSQADDMESAAGILSVMQQASLEPSADTYTILLCGYARKGDINSINKTFEICESKDICLLDKDILDVIYALTTNGHGTFVKLLLERLRKSSGYNQDAVNIILRLTNKGYEDIAFEILKTMPRSTKNDGELIDTGNFFIKQLVKIGIPTEKIMKICTELKNNELNAKPLLVAIEAGLTQGLYDTTLPLLLEAKNANLPIRQHYFWPLICTQKTEGDESIFNVLRQMQNDFNLMPSSETIREYVLPNVKEKNYDKLIQNLRSTGVSASIASTSTVYHILNTLNNLKDAADIASTYKVYYSPGLFRKPIVQSLSKTNDVDSYIRLLRILYDGIPRLESFNSKQNNNNNLQEDENDVLVDGVEGGVVDEIVSSSGIIANSNQSDVLGQMVYDVCVYFKKNRIDILTKILAGLVDQGLTMSSSQAIKIQDCLAAELTPEISTLLGKLTSGELEPIILERSVRNNHMSQMDIPQIEKLIETVEGKGENTKGLKRFLLASCFKAKNLEKTEEVIKKLEDDGYVLTTGVYAQLIDLYTHNEKLEDALRILSKIKTKEPDFLLDNMKTIKLVTLLTKNDRFDDALKILDEHKKDEQAEKTDEKTFNYQTTCWRLLNSFAELGKDNELQRMFDCLIKNNYVDVTNVMLGPLVKVHLINNNLTKAIDTFEEICNKYQSTPWKNELACKLIQAEDATNLQRLTDLSTNIHGEVNSLYDLVFSFVECGRIRQARKILETPGLRSRPQRINMACERYQQEGKIQSLEGLMEATKDLNHIDKSDIYYNLLLSYCKDIQPEKALGLWTKLQDENIPPTEKFLIKLGEFLKSQGLEVPFAIPKAVPLNSNINSKTEKKDSIEKPSQNQLQQKSQQQNKVRSVGTVIPVKSEGITLFRQALKRGEVDAALKAKSNLQSTEKLSVTDLSLLIEALVKSERLSEAKKIVSNMINENVYPVPRIFRYFLNKIAVSGDIKQLEEIGSRLTPEIKKIVSFDNRICHANIVAGKSEQYLQQLSYEIDNAKTEEDILKIGNKFPRGGAIGILEKEPELSEKFEEMAEKYAVRGIVGPMNVLWVHYFINENQEAYNRIWDKHLSTAPRLMFQRIVHLAREKQDEKLILRLIDLLKNTKVSEGAVGNAYSCLLDVYVVKNNYDDGLIALNLAIKDVCLENINRTALLRLKDGLEKNGKVFPHKIPEKHILKNTMDTTDSSSSSSSSSDDESKNKKNDVNKINNNN